MMDGPLALGDGPCDWQEQMVQPRVSGGGQGWDALASLGGRLSGPLQPRGSGLLQPGAQSGLLAEDLMIGQLTLPELRLGSGSMSGMQDVAYRVSNEGEAS